MLAVIKPDHFYQVRYNLWRFRGTYFSLSILEFPCTGDWLWVGLRAAICSNHCGGCTLFQKETDFGYDPSSIWLFTRYRDPPHHAKQSILSGWVLQNNVIQCSLHHNPARDCLPVNTSYTAPTDLKAPCYKVDMPILQGMVVYYAVSRVSDVSSARQ